MGGSVCVLPHVHEDMYGERVCVCVCVLLRVYEDMCGERARACVHVHVSAPGAWSAQDEYATPGIRHKVASNSPGAGKGRGGPRTPQRRTKPRTPGLKRESQASATGGRFLGLFYVSQTHGCSPSSRPSPARIGPGTGGWPGRLLAQGRLQRRQTGRRCPSWAAAEAAQRRRQAFYLGQVGGHLLGVISQAVGALQTPKYPSTCSWCGRTERRAVCSREGGGALRRGHRAERGSGCVTFRLGGALSARPEASVPLGDPGS
uniref:Uncharacterized protein n=1 Tax=Myotis myotis TaxID=51298 RepID=A0A7J7QYR4_MYOMY|nr:hypothetical protein mMyoMyo1_011258 [Myotis myotis]